MHLAYRIFRLRHAHHSVAIHVEVQGGSRERPISKAEQIVELRVGPLQYATMRCLRLHIASWFCLVTVCLWVVFLNSNLVRQPLAPYVDRMGFPETFWDTGQLDVAMLVVDVCLGVFVLFGTVAAIEIWCRTHGAPKVSLLSLFGATAGIGYFFYNAFKGIQSSVTESHGELSPDLVAYVFLNRIALLSVHLLLLAFGVAVVGWVKLIALAFKRRS